MRPRLLVIAGSLDGRVQELAGERLSIGRDETNDVCVLEQGVSRTHCQIERAGEEYEAVDLGSRNGTFVNGVPVLRRALAHGDTLRVGGTELVFLLHESAPEEKARRHRPIRLKDKTLTDTVSIVGWDRAGEVGNFALEVGRMARDLNALCKISSALNTIRDLDLFQQEVLKLIFEVVPADQGAMLLMDGVDLESASVCTWTRDDGAGQAVDVQQELVQRAVWEGAAVLTGSTGGEGARQPQVLCVPLVAVEKTLGAIYLSAAAAAFREDHAYFLDSVSRIAAVTVENIMALDALRSENRRLKETMGPASRLVGESGAMKKLSEMIARVGPSASTVLIRGESGTGKEVVARSLHESSERREKPFVAINCAAIPETLLESELFGHDKGAFTGATGTRLGKLEAGGDGTLFLDEIGELAPPMQAKLLRVLQQREFERLGGTKSLPLRARVLAATNRNLEESIKSGEFRQDLYYRLNVVSIRVPPLREHRDDIPLLALFFATKYAELNQRPFKGVSQRARELLMGYSWPGNVRELENAIEHAVVLGLADEIVPDDLPENILEEQAGALPGNRYHDALTEKKKELVEVSLREAKGNFPDAARLLGIHPKYLHRLVRNLKMGRSTAD